MRLQAALFFAACLSPAAAIYSDEVNHIDFHHALLGAPSPDSTFFLKPSTSSNASLLYTLSDKLLVGAVNPRDGALVWRQNISRSADSPAHGAGLLRGLDGNDAVVAAVGNYIASWSAQDGKVGWENRVSKGVVADLELLELEDATATSGVRDTIAVVASDGAGIVRRLDGNTGKSVWEFKDTSGDVPFQVSSSSTEVFYISLQSAMLKGFKIKFTALDPLTGRQTRQQILNSEADVATPESVLYVGANSASPIIVWTDKSQKSLKVNVIGTKEVTSIAIDNTTGSEIQKITVHAPHKLNALPHFLVHFATEAGAWAEVYHVDLVSAKVTKAYRLPYLPGQSAVAASVIDANVYFTRITDLEAIVVSSASHGVLGRWDLQKPSSDVALHSVSEVVAKGKSVAVRSALFRKHGDWELVRNGQIEWTRHEGLIDAVAATWAETDAQEDLAHELEVEGHETLYGAYLHRVKRHIRDLEHLPDWLKDLPKRILSSILADEVSNLDSFGVAKSVIVATKNGRVYALDTANHGAVSWGIQAVETSQWNVKAILASPGVATIYSDDGSSVTVDVSTGEIVSRIEPSNSKLHSIAVFGAQDGSLLATVGVREDGTPVTAFADEDGFLVTTSVDGRVLGWVAKDNKTPVWEFVPPSGQKVVEATARPAHDPVASIGRVLGNRSVLYKYLNPNLAVVTAVNEQTHTASFYLLDGVSGKVLHATTQAGVDSTQPIASVMSENWFAYSFWGDVDGSETSAKGYQLVISELYESPLPNDRGVLDSATNYSSTATLPLPHVISQAFMIPESISHMAVTQTRQGITTRQLLCTLPSSNSIVGIPRPVLDPRRPVDRDPTTAEAEEGLFRYAPYLDFDGKWYLSHTRDVAGIKAVLSRPTLLESTSLIFAYGSDIYGTRATPSQAFDILGKSFSKLQLVLTVVALGAGVAVLAPMTRTKQVNALWRA
ncbi:ER membrane protein complex subunit 1 [Penicillium expansum]|uniref:ER membrane protein complex subunit 1 n=1 Tax=Penicillium expansum TaxID=27334 RepID=A0A0A2J4P9_PENEN|nr:ER membrane protein complex subunit 1 [Penicillium expansum]KGO50299.1 ER membrane protein complex subunit 1 [Penicillium expansum]